jgi:hypothetical protein
VVSLIGLTSAKALDPVVLIIVGAGVTPGPLRCSRSTQNFIDFVDESPLADPARHFDADDGRAKHFGGFRHFGSPVLR